MSPRVIAAVALALVVGVTVGLFVGRALDDDGGAGGTPPASTEDCAEATEAVDAANERIGEIFASEAAPNLNYFAALVVEQGSIAYTMEGAPACFTLAERAGSAAFLEGLRILADGAANDPAADLGDLVAPGTQPPPTTSAGDDGE